MRLGRAAIELGKLTKSKDISLDTKVKITHTLVFPIMMYKVASWTVKKADRKKISLWGKLSGYPVPPEGRTMG